jgi:hypothetical protein
MREILVVGSLILVGLSFVVTLLAGYITNIIYLFNIGQLTLTGETILSIIGVFIPPLGALHGIYTWF